MYFCLDCIVNTTTNSTFTELPEEIPTFVTVDIPSNIPFELRLSGNETTGNDIFITYTSTYVSIGLADIDEEIMYESYELLSWRKVTIKISNTEIWIGGRHNNLYLNFKLRSHRYMRKLWWSADLNNDQCKIGHVEQASSGSHEKIRPENSTYNYTTMYDVNNETEFATHCKCNYTDCGTVTCNSDVNCKVICNCIPATELKFKCNCSSGNCLSVYEHYVNGGSDNNKTSTEFVEQGSLTVSTLEYDNTVYGTGNGELEYNSTTGIPLNATFGNSTLGHSKTLTTESYNGIGSSELSNEIEITKTDITETGRSGTKHSATTGSANDGNENSPIESEAKEETHVSTNDYIELNFTHTETDRMSTQSEKASSDLNIPPMVILLIALIVTTMLVLVVGCCCIIAGFFKPPQNKIAQAPPPPPPMQPQPPDRSNIQK
ncbi:uncharacterized protein [Antedon mediterranea]|uniref:uncharacterized protein n=1 Tax=Antedon mediterranea TaxID=105859 RepID=UPI003AF614AA